MLIDKFNKITVKPVDRIRDDDRAFCEAHQEAYEKARSVLKQTAKLAGDAQREQMNILKRVESEIYRTYLGYDNDFGAETFLRKLDETHRAFIQQLVGYFRNKYHVSLDDEAIYDALVQCMPEEPRKPSSFFYLNQPTEDEQKKFIEIKIAYEKAVADVEKHNRELIIRYEKVMDLIFAQLGGGSFRDTALKELRDACHAACWYSHNGQPKFEQKKSVIHYTGYGCSVNYIREKYKDKDEESEFHLTDDMKKVIEALSYFELGTQTVGMDSINSLCGYSVRGAKHPIPGKKVVGLQLFKTNRVDIRFASEAYAREFVEEFMGTVA